MIKALATSVPIYLILVFVIQLAHYFIVLYPVEQSEGEYIFFLLFYGSTRHLFEIDKNKLFIIFTFFEIIKMHFMIKFN